MTIREAVLADIPAIARIWNFAILETTATFTSEQKTPGGLSNLLDAQPFFVWEDSGEVVGFATYGPFRSGPGYAGVVEHSIYLGLAATGRGIGRRLLKALEDHARAGGMRVMIAGIGGENDGAINFHAAMGYVETARMPGIGQKFDRLHDLIFMQKDLTLTD